MFRVKPPGPAGLPPASDSPRFGKGDSPPGRPHPPAVRDHRRYEPINLPWWLIAGWLAAVGASTLALRPLNDALGRQPATLIWLAAVLAGTFLLRAWATDARLSRIDAGWIGAPGRAWRRFEDRFEHVFIVISVAHALAIFAAVLNGIANTGPVARIAVVGFVALLVPFTVWASIQARRDLTARAQRYAERELRFAPRATVRHVDDINR